VGTLGHRIANFPNYVTLTSSLTHHRIVNLGQAALRPPALARARARVTRRLAPDVIVLSHRLFHDVIMIRHQ